jgi:anti-sigma regulatory factor (Ser/Thr protein kinase)
VGDVELRFPPAPGQVRTARLVAVSVARRAGLDDVRLDEVRLAVGEACARSVNRCLAGAVTARVLLRMEDGGPGLVAEVVDEAKDDGDDDPVMLALLAGLADSMEVLPGPNGPGGRLRLEWWMTGSSGPDRT